MYNEGGHFVWRLGPKCLDYIDGRAIPFGDQSFLRLDELMQSDPDSSEWEKEADRYAINTLLIPIARYEGLTPVSSSSSILHLPELATGLSG